MKSLKNEQPERYLQFASHWVYILLSLQIVQSYQPIINFIISSVLAVTFIYLGKRFVNKEYFNHSILSILVVCNSTYLNAFYKFENFFIFLLLIFIAINVKLFFRSPENKGLLNPSITSIFICSMLLPSYVNYGPEYWSSEWWQLLPLFILGNFVTYKASTLILSWSYIVGTICFSYLLHPIFTHFKLVEHVANPISWTIGLISFIKILFIFHVISDPSTSPQTRNGKILFGLSVAFWEVLLKYYLVLSSTLIAYMLTLTVYILFSQSKYVRSKLITT